MNGSGIIRSLTIILVTLKLTNIISTEWIWVLSPLWILALVYGTIKIVEFAIRWSMK